MYIYIYIYVRNVIPMDGFRNLVIVPIEVFQMARAGLEILFGISEKCDFTTPHFFHIPPYKNVGRYFGLPGLLWTSLEAGKTNLA